MKFKNIIIVWANSEYIEEDVPLLFIAKRNISLGYDNEFDLVFLSGFDLLNKKYKNDLENVGYNLVNAEKIYSEYSRKYNHLDHFGDYEKKCFLRWLIVEDIYKKTPVIHYDGDIILNESTRIIAKLVQNKTFVFQGCPAFTVISDPKWFKIYRAQLDAFINNIEQYSAKAWTERTGWEITQKTKWAGSRFRKTISSDQDLISHLIHTDRIIQDEPVVVETCLKDYALFENPLYIHELYIEKPIKYQRIMNVDYFNEKKVLFWHLQSYYNRYLAIYMFRKKYLFFLSGIRLRNQLEEFDAVSKIMGLFYSVFRLKVKRLDVYKYFFNKDRDLFKVLNKKSWWKKGVFL